MAKLSEDSDFQLALRLQKELDNEYGSNDQSEDFSLAVQLQEKENKPDDVILCGGKTSKGKSVSTLANESWELIDPTPDARGLFVEFNKTFFWGILASVEVSWSSRMTMCAGICSFAGRKSGYCAIRLSAPLLKLRPRKDLLETLLHEMIHAYLFITNNNKDRDGHGPEFKSHMMRINKETGLNITVYHDFHDEVALYKTHWWKCNGPCQHKHPFYGLVKRAMNRAPSSNDQWWAQHQATCGGLFVKLKEPEGFGKKDARGRGVGGSVSGVGSSGVVSGGGSVTVGGTKTAGSFNGGGSNIHGFGKVNDSNVSSFAGNNAKPMDKYVTKLDGERGKDGEENNKQNDMRKGKTLKGWVKLDVDSNIPITSGNNNNFNNNGNNNGNSDQYFDMNDLLKNLNAERLRRFKRKRSESADDGEYNDGINNGINDSNNIVLSGNCKKPKNSGMPSADNDLITIEDAEIEISNVNNNFLSPIPKYSDSIIRNSINIQKNNSNILTNNNGINTSNNNDTIINSIKDITITDNKLKSENNLNGFHRPQTFRKYRNSNTRQSHKWATDWASISNGVSIEKSPKNEKDRDHILSDSSLKPGSTVILNGFKSVTRGAKVKPLKNFPKTSKYSDYISPVSDQSKAKNDHLTQSNKNYLNSADISDSIKNDKPETPKGDYDPGSSKIDTEPSTSSQPPTISSPQPSLSSSSSYQPNRNSTPTLEPPQQPSSSHDYVNCPICDLKLPLNLINQHLDNIH